MKKLKKAALKKSMIHQAFPPQGQEQPAHMGSQSSAPNLDMQMLGPQGPQGPIGPGETAASGEY